MKDPMGESRPCDSFQGLLLDLGQLLYLAIRWL